MGLKKITDPNGEVYFINEKGERVITGMEVCKVEDRGNVAEHNYISQAKSNNSKRLLYVIISIIVIALISTLVKQVVKNSVKSSNNSFEAKLIKIAHNYNKNAPFMIDSGTRFDNSSAVGKTIFYNYTLIKYNIDEIDIDYFNSRVRTNILNGIKTNSDMKILKDNKVTFIYYYRDKTGKFFTSFKFTPEEY